MKKKIIIVGVTTYIVIVLSVVAFIVERNNRREVRYDLTTLGGSALIMSEMSRSPMVKAAGVSYLDLKI